MCGGSNRDISPVAQPVRLRDIDTSEAQRPKTQSHGPRSSRPKSQARPAEHRPPASSHTKRPSTSEASGGHNERPSTTGGTARKARPSTADHTSKLASRPSSSRRPRTSATGYGGPSKGKHPESRGPHTRFNPIPEASPVQYTQDQTIVDRFAALHTHIDQHAENFYGRDDLGYGDSIFDDPVLRHGIIRYTIAREILGSIIKSNRDRYFLPADFLPSRSFEIPQITVRASKHSIST